MPLPDGSRGSGEDSMTGRGATTPLFPERGAWSPQPVRGASRPRTWYHQPGYSSPRRSRSRTPERGCGIEGAIALLRAFGREARAARSPPPRRADSRAASPRGARYRARTPEARASSPGDTGKRPAPPSSGAASSWQPMPSSATPPRATRPPPRPLLRPRRQTDGAWATAGTAAAAPARRPPLARPPHGRTAPATPMGAGAAAAAARRYPRLWYHPMGPPAAR